MREDGAAPAEGRSRAARLLVGYPPAAVAVALATGLAWPLHPLVELANLTMTYLLAVVVVATRYGRGPSLFTSIASVAAFDFFFVPPYFTFAVADTQYLLTFAVMLVVGLVISGLTARIRSQAEAARHREQRTAALYAMSRELAEAATIEDLVAIGARHIAAVFEAQVAVFLPDAAGALTVSREEGGFVSSESTVTVGRWVLEHRQPAGAGTPGTPAADALYLPLVGPRGPLGVVGVRPLGRDAVRAPESLHQLETFVNQLALAVARARLADEAQSARVRAETERLRNALLTSVSHDLRTPLAAITGAATTILETGVRLDEPTRRELLESVRDEAERLNRLVQNLLQMTRLESGALQLRHDWHPLEEVVGAALGRLGPRLGKRRVTVNIPPELPLVPIDDVLVEQVLVNLVDNAIKHTPAESPIRIMATATERAVTVEVADHGPGLPRGAEDRVFEKFYQAAPDGRRGVGLGLAICRGIVDAHGGRIWAHNLPEGGVAFLFTLPLAGGAPASLPTDA